MSEIHAFLARAVPWPTADRPGYVDIHWTNRDPKTGAFRGLTGHAYVEHVQAAGFTTGMNKNPVDLYVCMSLQGEADQITLNKKGKPRRRAMRSWEQALWLRSHWIDVDVKPGFFNSTAEAMEAFKAWCAKVGMPEPTFIVMTGSGGFHVHWVYDEPVSRETWLPIAYAIQQALKVEKFPCDYGVIVNPACVLRIPGTKNHKFTPPTDVVLAQALPFTYPFAFIAGQMAPYMVSYALPVTTAAAGPKLAFKPNPKLANLPVGPRLDAGLMQWLPTLEDVGAECPFLRDTLATGGKGYSEPLWNESLKIAAFCDQPEASAHELSEGHDDFDPDETDKKFAYVQSHHGNGKVGWPQCRTINAAGAHQCTQCPHFVDNKSPLNYAEPPKPVHRPSAPSNVTPIPTPFMTSALLNGTSQIKVPIHSLPNMGYGPLPIGHKYANDGRIHADVEVVDKAGNVTIQQELVFPNPIYHIDVHEPTAEGLGHHGMSFECQTDASHVRKVVLNMADVAEQRSFNSALSEQAGLASEDTPKLRRMLLSFRDQMIQRKRSSQRSEALGWSVSEGASEPDGFCYGGLRYTAAGRFPYAPTDVVLNKKYMPTGSLDVWKQAAALIIDQQRQDLVCAIAASFGAPLLYWTGMSGVVLSIWSNGSGIGKTHVMRASQAVWGNPKTGMGSLNDTSNFVNGAVSQLRHLPFFYDELRQEADTKKLVDMIFAMGQGKSKGRMTASAEIKEVYSFATIMTVASNNSLMSYINEHVATTAAGMNRIFEIEIKPAPNAPGRIDSTVAQQINGSLETNFGHAGAIYADYLGRNIPAMKAAISHTMTSFNDYLGADHDERFWVTAIAVLVLGAKYANHLGLTKIDENALAGYLCDRFRENRAYRQGAPVDMGKASNTMRYVHDYLNAHRDGTLVTDVVWTQQGKPPASFKAVQVDANHDLTGKRILVRLAVGTKVLRISLADFGRWLKKERNVQRDIIIEALKTTAGAKAVKVNLGASTKYKMAREDALEFDLNTLPDLLE